MFCICLLHSYAYQLWGFMELNAAGDTDKAREVYLRGTKACPKAASLWMSAADLEDKSANVTDARRFYCEAAMADPRNPSVWHAWGCMEVSNSASYQRHTSANGEKSSY